MGMRECRPLRPRGRRRSSGRPPARRQRRGHSCRRRPLARCQPLRPAGLLPRTGRSGGMLLHRSPPRRRRRQWQWQRRRWRSCGRGKAVDGRGHGSVGESDGAWRQCAHAAFSGPASGRSRWHHGEFARQARAQAQGPPAASPSSYALQRLRPAARPGAPLNNPSISSNSKRAPPCRSLSSSSSS